MRSISILDEHQNNGVDFLINNPKTFIMWDMGGGKTVTTLTAYEWLLFTGEISKVLIISHPSIVDGVWQNEAKQWSELHSLSFNIINDVTQTTYGIDKAHTKAMKSLVTRLHRDIANKHVDEHVYIREKYDNRVNYIKAKFTNMRDNLYQDMERFDFDVISVFKLKWLIESGKIANYDALILDESSLFKSYNSKRFEEIKKLKKRANFKHITLLSGTPNSNSYQDLWSQLYILDDGKLLGKNITSFRRNFMRQGYQKYIWDFVDGATDRIKSLIKPLCLNNDFTISLPRVTYHDVNIDIGDDVKSSIDNFRRTGLIHPDTVSNARLIELFKEYSKLSNANDCDINIDAVWSKQDEFDNLLNEADTSDNVITIYGKLLQMASGSYYALDEDGNKIAKPLHNAKITELSSMIDLYDNEKFIIVYNFDEERIQLTNALHTYNYKVYDRKNATQILKNATEGKIQYLLLHSKSISHGVNGLQNAFHNIIWYSPTTVLENYLQMNKRIDRRGQTKNVNIFKFICTEDEKKLYNNLHNKNMSQKDLLKSMMIYIGERTNGILQR